jgi:excisionase family DNA binding protein
MADELLTTGAAAAVLGVSDETLRRWVEDKRVRHIRLPSGQLRFRRSDLDELLTPVEPTAPTEAAS